MSKCSKTKTTHPDGLGVCFECGHEGGRCSWCGGTKWKNKEAKY